MSDLRTLHDAFAELERRADAAGTSTAVRQRRAVRLVPVAASVVAVAGLVAGAVWLAPGDPGTHVAGPPTTSTSSTTRDPVPHSPDDLIARFRVVLGDTATVEVTRKHVLPSASPSSNNPAVPPPGAGSEVTLPPPPPEVPDASTSALVSGTLTSAGVTGSFGLTIHPSDSEPDARCGSRMVCDVSTLPDGSRLATGTARPDSGAVAHLACLRRTDGTMVLLLVSNQEDPSGAVIGTPGGEVYAPRPPLTLDQMKAIVTSDRW